MRSAIPTVEEFQELIDILAAKKRTELNEPLQKLLAQFLEEETLNPADVQSFVDQCDSALKTQREETEKLVAFRWLSEQRGLDEGFKSMQRANRRRFKPLAGGVHKTFSDRLQEFLEARSQREIIKLDQDRLQRLLDKGLLDEFIKRSKSRDFNVVGFERFLERYRDRIQFHSLHPIAVAFQSYFYFDRPAELRSLQDKLTRIKKTASEISQLIEETISSDCPSVMQISQSLTIAQRNADRLAGSIEQEMSRFKRAMEVSARKDSSAKERVLVHDLHFGLWRRSYWRSGAAALAEFLTCEGVVNRLDTRTIERLLARWKAAETDAKTGFE